MHCPSQRLQAGWNESAEQEVINPEMDTALSFATNQLAFEVRVGMSDIRASYTPTRTQVLFTDGVYIMAENLTKTSQNTSVLLREAAQILFAQIDA